MTPTGDPPSLPPPLLPAATSTVSDCSRRSLVLVPDLRVVEVAESFDASSESLPSFPSEAADSPLLAVSPLGLPVSVVARGVVAVVSPTGAGDDGPASGAAVTGGGACVAGGGSVGGGPHPTTAQKLTKPGAAPVP